MVEKNNAGDDQRETPNSSKPEMKPSGIIFSDFLFAVFPAERYCVFNIHLSVVFKLMLNLVKINYMAQNDMQNSAQSPSQQKMHPVKKFFRRVLLFFIVLFLLTGIG